MHTLVAFLIAPFVFAPFAAFAQGAVPIRIYDGPKARCIDPAQDRVWVTLRRVITTKSSDWFAEDRSVGILISADVKASQAAKTISFPLLTEATMEPWKDGRVSIPIEYTIVSGLRLEQDRITYSGIGIEMTLLNRRSRNKWGAALQSLGEIAKKLPIPASPIAHSATYLLDFANSAIEKELAAQRPADKAKSAALAFNFDPSGECASGDFERTGTVALLQAGVGDNRIDLGRTTDYCWTADLTPVFVLKAAKRDPAKVCDSPDYRPAWFEVSNNYVAYFINAVRDNRSFSIDDQDSRDAMRRCEANGISAERCLETTPE